MGRFNPDAAGPPVSGGGSGNLLGRARTGSGAGRRNENVQFNLIDNNPAAVEIMAQRLARFGLASVNVDSGAVELE